MGFSFIKKLILLLTLKFTIHIYVNICKLVFILSTIFTDLKGTKTQLLRYHNFLSWLSFWEELSFRQKKKVFFPIRISIFLSSFQSKNAIWPDFEYDWKLFFLLKRKEENRKIWNSSWSQIELWFRIGIGKSFTQKLPNYFQQKMCFFTIVCYVCFSSSSNYVFLWSKR